MKFVNHCQLGLQTRAEYDLAQAQIKECGERYTAQRVKFRQDVEKYLTMKNWDKKRRLAWLREQPNPDYWLDIAKRAG